MNPRRLCTLAIMMIFFCTMVLSTSPFSKSSSSFDYAVQLQHETMTLIPGDNETLSLFVNQSRTMTGDVLLQGTFVGLTPEELFVDIHPTSGTTPFVSTIMVRSSVDANPGSYIYQINTSSGGMNHTLYLRINVTTNVDVTLHTDKDRYLKGQTIHLFGNATTTSGYPLTSGSVIFIITTNQRNMSLVTRLHNSSYEYFYPISYGDDEGQWTIQARVVGNASQVGIQTTHVTVSLPLGIMRYTVDFYSPPNSAVYRRGDSFSISVYVTENSRGVQNATTRCRIPSMETVSLLEYSPGNYKQNYTIPWNAPLGELFFTVESTKNVSGALKAGGSVLSITVQPAPLQLTVVKPVSLQVSAPSSISLEVRVQYPDKTIMRTGDVFAIMPQEDEHRVVYREYFFHRSGCWNAGHGITCPGSLRKHRNHKKDCRNCSRGTFLCFSFLHSTACSKRLLHHRCFLHAAILPGAASENDTGGDESNTATQGRNREEILRRGINFKRDLRSTHVRACPTVFPTPKGRKKNIE